MTARGSTAALEVVPAGPVGGRVRAPASKSVTNRALVTAALATGVSTLRAPLDSDDSTAMRDCLRALGAVVDLTAEHWRVTGTGGDIASPHAPLDARLSGTTARFVTAVCALGRHGGEVTGHAPLRRRPIRPLVDALRSLGAKADDTDGGLPVRIAGGGLVGGTVEVDVSGSSQFGSAVLLVAPYARADVVCRFRGRTAADYIALTVDLMRSWGAQVDDRPDGWRVRAGSGYLARSVDVEYDASAAAHLHALAAASGGSVTVTNAVPTRQPDAGAVEVLAAFGCEVARRSVGVTVTSTGALRPVDVSLAAMPDQVSTFGALAALAPGTSVLRDVGVARMHETDRLEALTTELGRLGVEVEQAPDTLTIHGGGARGPATLRTHDDHRLAMAFAAIGSRVAGVTILDPGCVAKTYPAFWDDARALGCDLRHRGGEVVP
ncbi:MAG TPA: 3-phosphoshikimate 1-carboxyvinyltransferase [Euzebyales bacterium]|nr:3-phosphoshikimate 1-carboxyvinyltransferase [Euzebyales bacterium]